MSDSLTSVTDQYGLLSLPTLYSAEEAEAPYTQYDVMVTYIWQGNTSQLPVAGTSQDQDQSSVVMQTARPTCQKVVEWTAVRQGLKPSLPHPIPSDPNLTLSSVQIKVFPPKIVEPGTYHQYAVSGVYVYLCAAPWVPGTDTLQGSAPPSDVTSITQNTITAAQFKQGII